MAGEQLITAAARAATGTGATQAGRRALTMADVGILDQLVADLPAAQQLALGRRFIAHPSVESSPLVRGPMAAIRSGLAPVQAGDVAASTLLAQVRANLDQEIDRIDGLIPSRGYDGHPDYMVVGAIRDNLTILEGMRAI